MKRSAVDLLLIIVIVIGGAVAWQTGQERSRLEREHDRLVQKTGALPIGDASQAHFQAIPTGEPLHFAWRVFYPPNYKQVLKQSTGGWGTSQSSSSSEFIARVRIRENEQGALEVYTRISGHCSRSSLGDSKLAELLRGRWDKIRVEQFGAAGRGTVKPDQSAVLLRLTLPDDLQAEARTKLSP
ncbi:MAG TPA: hypothetical protein VGY53_03960, partial [Isosphaeraceae bacterium]|nr:hypothetical protein [Isosphaeraceae bacterium]